MNHLTTVTGIMLWLLSGRAVIAVEATSAVAALPQAHAHNDYHHARPLFDALEQGFASVEADVFLVDGQLLVGHDKRELRPSRTLDALYLKPLAERVARNGGHVYPDLPTFMLLVDIKENGAAANQALDSLLKSYAPMLASVADGKAGPGAVEIVISGDRPWQLIADDDVRYVGIDGRVEDLSDPARRELPAHLMPLGSDNWFTHFRWTGDGPMPEDERAKLKRIVASAHDQGRRVRFWATPEKEAVWQELAAAGVDHINTDQLERLGGFLRERQ